MTRKFKKISALFLFCIISTMLGLLGCISCKTNKFVKTPTFRTNQKKYIKPDTTEIYVLGTVHKPTTFISIDTLYNVLETIKPNIILFEYDSTAFDSKMNLKTRFSLVFPSFLKRFQQIEGVATKKYLYFNTFAIIRPYEWEERNKFHRENGILTKPNEIFAEVEKLNTSNKLNPSHKKILSTFYSLTHQANSFADSSLYAINSKLQDSILEQRQNYQYHEIKKIIDENDDLQQYRDFYKINEGYWDIRNKAMVDNIIKIVQKYPRSRIVVLNGYFHRYYLLKELRLQQENLNIKILELNNLIK